MKISMRLKKFVAPVLVLASATLGLAVATAAPASAIDRQVTIHYNRPDGNYAAWNLWIWGVGGDAGVSNPGLFNGEDSFGKKSTWTITDSATTRIGFIVRTNDWAKDPDGDRFIDLPAQGTTDIWLLSGDSTVYTSNPFRTVTIHYNRPDGEYGDWNLWIWGVGGESNVENPGEFNGEDSYGVKSTWTITDQATTKLGFIVRTNDWAKDPDGDRFIDLPATGNVEIWLRSGDATVYRYNPFRQVTIHYNRPDAQYDAWNLWIWGVNGEANVTSPGLFNGEDDYGVKRTWYVTDQATTKIGFIVRTNDWAKDPDGDRFIDLPATGNVEVWLKSGDSTVYTSDPRGRTLIVHYWRPEADYDGWTMWTWNATPDDQGTHDWINPLEFNGTDDMGVTYTNYIADPLVTRIGLLLRYGNWVSKDPDNNDRFVNISASPVTEIWFKQGITQVFYSNPWGDDPTAQSAAIHLSGITSGSTVGLPAKTNRGAVIKWVSYTPSTCAIASGRQLKVYRPGACRIVGSAAAITYETSSGAPADARAVSFKRTVTIK